MSIESKLLLLLTALLLSISLSASIDTRLADAINEANANPGKHVSLTLATSGGVQVFELMDPLPAIKEGANLSIVGGCFIHFDTYLDCYVKGTGRDPIFHADKSARHCQLHIEGIVFINAKGAVLYDLP